MQKFYIITFTILCTYFSIPVTYGQTDFRKGYIVSLTNDTITGLIDYRGYIRNSRVCTFKKTESSTTFDYSPTAIKAFGYMDSKKYESRIVKVDSLTVEPVFLELLIKGRVTFYYLKNPHIDRYFLSKDTISPVELIVRYIDVDTDKGGVRYRGEVKTYLGVLTWLMEDCNQVKKKIKNTRLAYKNLMNLVTEYNSCFDSNEKGFKTTKPLATLRTGPLIGMDYSQMRFYSTSSEYNYLSKPTFKTKNNIVLGWSFNTTLPKINEKISLQVEALYVSNNYSSYYEAEVNDTLVRDDIFIRVKYAKLPILIRYTYPRGKLRPFVQAGIYMAYIANSKNHIIREAEYRGVVATQEQQAMITKAFQQGAIAGIGMQINILTKPTFFEIRIERGNGINATSQPSSYPYSRNTNISFIYSIGF